MVEPISHKDSYVSSNLTWLKSHSSKRLRTISFTDEIRVQFPYGILLMLEGLEPSYLTHETRVLPIKR